MLVNCKTALDKRPFLQWRAMDEVHEAVLTSSSRGLLELLFWKLLKENWWCWPEELVFVEDWQRGGGGPGVERCWMVTGAGMLIVSNYSWQQLGKQDFLFLSNGATYKMF